MLGTVCPVRQIKEHQSVRLVERTPVRKTGLHAMVLVRLTQVESVSSIKELSIQSEQNHVLLT